MNLLYDALPDTVTVDGKAYRIYTDYRDWLRFYDMQEDDGLSKREKLLLMLEWYIDKPPLSCLEEALEALIGFATRSEEQPEQRPFLPDKCLIFRSEERWRTAGLCSIRMN